MTEIEVSCVPGAAGWRCAVRVGDGARSAMFDVTARDPSTLLPPGTDVTATEVEHLVTETFRFLLEREPVSSILSSFDPSVVARYFPEYPTEIRRRLSG